MPRKTSEIVDDLRSHAISIETLGNYVTGAEYAQIQSAAKSMREAAERLDKSINVDAFNFGFNSYAACDGVQALAEAIEDGSIEDKHQKP